MVLGQVCADFHSESLDLVGRLLGVENGVQVGHGHQASTTLGIIEVSASDGRWQDLRLHDGQERGDDKAAHFGCGHFTIFVTRIL